MREFTAVFQQDGDWWIGSVEAVGGPFAQERTLDKARASLAVALRHILELRRQDSPTDTEGTVRETIRIDAA